MRHNETYENLISEERLMDGCLYRYRLLSRNENEKTFYSISAEMKSRNDTGTCAMVYDVFQTLEDAEAFFFKLVSYLATPINLPYVVEDEIVAQRKEKR